MKDLTHTIWSAPLSREEDNEVILPTLETIQKKGGEVRILQFGNILEHMAKMVKLPFLETPEGERYYGVNSINRYVRTYEG